MMADERKGLWIPRVVLEDEGLGQTMKLVYAVMIEGMDEQNICRMSAQDVADRLKLTGAAVNCARLKLCDFGYMRRVPHTRSNYRILKIKKKRKEPNNE